MKSTALTFSIVPFKQVGPLVFGMSQEEIRNILGDPDKESKTFTGRLAESRKEISVKYKKGQMEEVSFLQGVDLLFEEQRLLTQSGIDYLLNNYEHQSDLGFTIFPTLGIAFTGFGKSKDTKTVSVFNKKVLKEYLTQ
ncbi:hypothetical protein [Fibrella aquatilis]|uniref:Uncharacterized protein n=1 Tax=Fibrella aquatilis TaxID=2817059 RepID=A0A939JXT7_9BACT|nr:hypothetical protein [Fibrella aquatilis]MBO0933307.1 hypothetical protein [Fibrella aquatilis]